MKIFSDAKTALAFTITVASISGMVTISSVYIYYSDNKEVAAERVFGATLPLFGTWVATLLAYYFAKDNFDSATRSTKELAQLSYPSRFSKLEAILVSQAISSRLFVETDRGKSIDTIKNELIKVDRKRLPVVSRDQGNLQFLTYYEDLDAYSINQSNKTLGDFITDLPSKNKPVVFVSEDITLAQANEKRKRVTDCRDIMVTENGRSNGRVIGYLTDFDIDRFSRS